MTGMQLNKKQRQERDSKVIELYQQGITPANIQLRFGNIDIYRILKRNGIKSLHRKIGENVTI